VIKREYMERERGECAERKQLRVRESVTNQKVGSIESPEVQVDQTNINSPKIYK
jgi:hypothetical protein